METKPEVTIASKVFNGELERPVAPPPPREAMPPIESAVTATKDIAKTVAEPVKKKKKKVRCQWDAGGENGRCTKKMRRMMAEELQCDRCHDDASDVVHYYCNDHIHLHEKQKHQEARNKELASQAPEACIGEKIAKI